MHKTIALLFVISLQYEPDDDIFGECASTDCALLYAACAGGYVSPNGYPTDSDGTVIEDTDPSWTDCQEGLVGFLEFETRALSVPMNEWPECALTMNDSHEEYWDCYPKLYYEGLDLTDEDFK